MPSPLPPHACSIFSRGDKIILSLPADKGYSQTLEFPSTPAGMACAVKVLSQRERAFARSVPNAIGTKAMPIQYVIDQMLLSEATKKADRERLSQKPLSEQADKVLDNLDSLLDQI